jgi:hypothetical protein
MVNMQIQVQTKMLFLKKILYIVLRYPIRHPMLTTPSLLLYSFSYVAADCSVPPANDVAEW